MCGRVTSVDVIVGPASLRGEDDRVAMLGTGGIRRRSGRPCGARCGNLGLRVALPVAHRGEREQRLDVGASCRVVDRYVVRAEAPCHGRKHRIGDRERAKQERSVLRVRSRTAVAPEREHAADVVLGLGAPRSSRNARHDIHRQLAPHAGEARVHLGADSASESARREVGRPELLLGEIALRCTRKWRASPRARARRRATRARASRARALRWWRASPASRRGARARETRCPRAHEEPGPQRPRGEVLVAQEEDEVAVGHSHCIPRQATLPKGFLRPPMGDQKRTVSARGSRIIAVAAPRSDGEVSQSTAPVATKAAPRMTVTVATSALLPASDSSVLASPGQPAVVHLASASLLVLAALNANTVPTPSATTPAPAAATTESVCWSRHPARPSLVECSGGAASSRRGGTTPTPLADPRSRPPHSRRWGSRRP